MPSPVPMSCSRKSLYGWMSLLPSAAGTVIVLPLIFVPGLAVRSVGVWHTGQPTFANSASPALTAALIAPRGGAFVERMKSANATTSTPSSSGSRTGS